MIFYDQSKNFSIPFLYVGMIVSISHSQILGLSFFIPLSVLNFGSVFFCSLCSLLRFFFHSPPFSDFGNGIMHSCSPLVWMTSINTFPPLRAHLYSQKCYGKLEKSKDRFLFPYFSLSYPLNKCQRRRLLIINSVKCEICGAYSPNMSEQGWRAIFKRAARDLGTFAS